MGEVRECGLCRDYTALVPVLDLGDQPLAERFGQDKTYPLKLLQCTNCGLVQLSYIVDAAEMFPADHPYTTATSAMQVQHFEELAWRLTEAYGLCADDLVVDIGANDGTLLSFYPDVRRVAVEPTGQARKCRERGLITYPDFFTPALADQIRVIHGQAKVITACNVLAHVPDPHDFMTGVTSLLADDGVFVTENHDLASVTGGMQVDAVYHEHLRYYSPATLTRLLELHGLYPVSSQRLRTYGGSFQVRAQKEPGPGSLAVRARSAAAELRDLLNELTPAGEIIYGIGAATRASTLIHFAQLAPYLTCVCERPDSEKIGKMMPGTKIPIVDEKALIEDQPEYALLLSYHLAGSIIPKLKQAGYTGQYIIPLPQPHVRVS